uniref:Uncharacterized protein n=1 Tax=Canis lupus familiaris TaxID=9615 RepID=A0A8C0RG10_CANLF
MIQALKENVFPLPDYNPMQIRPFLSSMFRIIGTLCNIYIYIYIYTYMCICVCVYIYIYKSIEKEEVDDFEKKFNALKVPVPEDKYTVQVDAEEKEDVKSCAEFLSLSKARIEEHEKELEKMKNIIPFDQMTIEDLNEVFPETKLERRSIPIGLTSQLKIYKLEEKAPALIL